MSGMKLPDKLYTQEHAAHNIVAHDGFQQISTSWN
jgi:hypothetical protein